MDERMRRQWAASEAKAYGRGGLQAVSRATQMAPNTIRKGIQELDERANNPGKEIRKRIREAGGGRKHASENDPELVGHLNDLVEPSTRRRLQV